MFPTATRRAARLALALLCITVGDVIAQPIPWQPTLSVTNGGAIGETVEVTLATVANAPSVIAASASLAGPWPSPLAPPLQVLFVGNAGASQTAVGRTSIPGHASLVGAPIHVQGASIVNSALIVSRPVTRYIAPNIPRRFVRVRPTPQAIATAGYGRAATVLADGTFLFTGGHGRGDVLPQPVFKTAIHYDATNDVLTRLPDLAQPRANHTAVRLADGKVVIVGGDAPMAAPTAELFDPATGRSTSLGPVPTRLTTALGVAFLDAARREWVLFAGGSDGQGSTIRDALLYDTVGRTFTTVGPMQQRRAGAAAMAVPGGVLITGGYDTTATTLATHASVELFHIQTRAFHPWGSMTRPRADHAMHPISTTAALIVGGIDTNWNAFDDLEVFEGLTARSIGIPLRTQRPRSQTRPLVLPDGALFLGDVLSSEFLTPTASTLLRPIPEQPTLLGSRFEFLPAPAGGVLAIGPQTLFYLR